MKVLALAAHPDDVELLCAGTLARLAQVGHDVVLAHMTLGDKGGTASPEELAEIRAAEARTAAAFVDAHCWGGICGDLELYAEDADQLARVREILDAERPDVVLTHPTHDYHADHRITARLVERAVGRSGPEADAQEDEIWQMDTLAGVAFAPERYVDITSAVETKQAMIRCHESQMEWMSSYRHTDLTYIIEWIGRWRGMQAGFPYAEGFAPADPTRTSRFDSLVAELPKGRA